MPSVLYDAVPTPQKTCGKCPCFRGPEGYNYCILSGKKVKASSPACQDFDADLEDEDGDAPSIPCKECGRLCTYYEIDGNFIDYCRECARGMY